MADVAIITGGTGSIGRAVCEVLAADGWICIAGDLVEPDEAVKPGVHFHPLDVGSADSIAGLLDRAQSIGTLRALVAAHGILAETPFGAPLDAAEEAAVDRIIDVNLKAVARLCSAAAPAIADGGAIVTLSSVTASMGRAKGAFAYQATKAGVEALTRTFAIALAPREIRVNCIQPGYLSEPMRGAGAQLRARQGGNKALEAFTPFGRLITPREVAEAIAFLCSRRASGISGTVLPVDGGQQAY
jgi:3-oxoacyl-[acyl-carrier protein] reductase